MANAGKPNFPAPSIPEVLANMIEGKLVNAMKFTPLCKVDNTLVGQPGNTVTLPQFAYIGDAADINELAPYVNAELTATTQQVTIKKIGKAVSISDEGDSVRLRRPRGRDREPAYRVACKQG